MEFYLIRHGHVDYRRAVDRFAVGLSPEGREQSERLAQQCREWDVQFIVASTMVRAEQTADAVARALPNVPRWDLDELAETGIEEQAVSPMMHPLQEHWTAEETALAYERTWVRVTAALARIEVYARAYGLERIAIIAHRDTVNLLVLNWLGLDWRALSTAQFDVDWCATTKVDVEDGAVRIAWVNRQV